MPIDLDIELNQITGRIIAAAIAVHRELGPGLLESTYQTCLEYELSQGGIAFRRQVPLPVTYRSTRLECGYRVDLVVEDMVLIEVKSVDRLAPIHRAQMITYLKLTTLDVGLLLNFNVTSMRDGIRRLEKRTAVGNSEPRESQ